jgi:cob(I)alamin adenosyltransferase
VSKSSEVAAVRAEPITLDDLRHKALKIREEVVDEAKATIADRSTQIILVGLVAAVAVISLAYVVGTRAGRRAAELPLDY